MRKLIALAVVVVATACSSITDAPEAASAKITTTCVKEPGPTNEAQGVNPAGQLPPGQQETITNQESNCQPSKPL